MKNILISIVFFIPFAASANPLLSPQRIVTESKSPIVKKSPNGVTAYGVTKPASNAEISSALSELKKWKKPRELLPGCDMLVGDLPSKFGPLRVIDFGGWGRVFACAFQNADKKTLIISTETVGVNMYVLYATNGLDPR
jgi:hypothetical protein